MCSSPKGGSSKPILSSQVDSLSGEMSSAEYSRMVHRANESFERRQEELIEYRKTHKSEHRLKKTSLQQNSFFDMLRSFFGQSRQSEQ